MTGVTGMTRITDDWNNMGDKDDWVDLDDWHDLHD